MGAEITCAPTLAEKNFKAKSRAPRPVPNQSNFEELAKTPRPFPEKA